MTGKNVSFAVGIIYGVIMALYFPLPLALTLSVPTGVFLGFLGAWYDRG